MRLSIKFKVIATMLIMLTLTLVTSYFSQTSLTKVKKTTLKIESGSSSRIPKIQKINTQYIETQTNMLIYFTETDLEKKTEVKEKQRELFINLGDEIASYLKSATEEQDIKNAKQLQETVENYSSYFESYILGNVRVSNVTDAGEKVGILLNDMITENTKESEEQHNTMVDTADQSLSTIRITNYIMVAVAILLVVFLMLIVVVPIEKVKSQLDNIIDKMNHNQFDMDERVVIKSKDEIGSLVGNINQLIGKMSGMVQLISDDAQRLIGSVQEVSKKVQTSNNSVGDISAAMEQLAASMQAATSSTQQVASHSEQVYEKIEKIAESAKDGSQFATELMGEARKSRLEAKESKTNTKEIVEDISSQLMTSIENSKQVNKIDELTEEILSISAQTNLLALNASIEAARAGEAGKGFSVVADEIRELADTSKATANTIQAISKNVMKAVHKLSEDSEKMVEFVEKAVLGDYDKFVLVAQHYYDGVNNFDEILQNYEITSTALKGTIHEIDVSLHMISSTIEDSTGAISTVAGNTSELVDAMAGVTEGMHVSELVSETLLEEVNKFTKQEVK